jgi:hypothetical protein
MVNVEIPRLVLSRQRDYAVARDDRTHFSRFGYASSFCVGICLPLAFRKIPIERQGDVPQALKRVLKTEDFNAALKRLRHPKSEFFRNL